MGRKRKNGEGTVRLRKDGRWEGRVVIGYDEKGLPKTKNALAKTKGECVEKLNALKSTITPPATEKVKADMTLETWARFWYQTYRKPTIRPTSQRNYEGLMRNYIFPKLGQRPLNKLTTQDFQQFFHWMKTDGRLRDRERYGPGLSDSVVHCCRGLCYSIMEKAAEERLIPKNPVAECKVSRGKSREMKLLTREELQRLLTQAKAEGYYEIFLLELTTGLRLGELAGLQWNDLNFKTGELRIERQIQRIDGKLVATESKTKATVRSVILPEPVLAVFREYKMTVASKWMFPSPKKENTPLAPAAASHRLALILEHAGCKKVRFHDLCHTFATNSLAAGMDVKTLSTIIGHASSATTLNTYAHITDDMKRAAAEKIDKGILGVEPQNDIAAEKPKPVMTDFQPRHGKHRYWGSGYLGKPKGSNRWNGRYTIKRPDGRKETRHVHADTKEECEALLEKLVTEMKRELAAERQRLGNEAKAG